MVDVLKVGQENRCKQSGAVNDNAFDSSKNNAAFHSVAGNYAPASADVSAAGGKSFFFPTPWCGLLS